MTSIEMTTRCLVLVLVPGAGGDGWYWHRVIDVLRSRGQEAIAVDLPGSDPDPALEEYRCRLPRRDRQQEES